jgi:outer membrane autotransporter protein
MKVFSPAPAPAAALAFAISQALYAMPALADDTVLAENGARVEVRDIPLSIVGNGRPAITARTGGQVHAQNVSIATSGNASYGIYVHGAGSLLDSQGPLTIHTAGNGAIGLYAERQGSVSAERIDVTTSGQDAHGIQIDSGAQARLQAGTITTRGSGSHGITSLADGAVVTASGLHLRTEGERSRGVHVNRDATVILGDSHVTTVGRSAHGLYAIGGALQAEDVKVSTHGAAAVGVFVLATDHVARLRQVDVRTEGRNSHGIQVDRGHAVIEDSVVNALDGYGLMVVERDSAGRQSSVLADRLRITGGGGVAVIDAHLSLSNSTIHTSRDGFAGLGISRGGLAGLDRVVIETFGDDAPALVLDGGQLTAHDSDIQAHGSDTVSALGGDNRLVLDNSRLSGTVRVEESTSLRLDMRNGSRLNGEVQHVTSMNLSSGSQWNMLASSSVGALHLDGGHIGFGDPAQFYTLSLGELSGSGSFSLSLNMQDRQIDFIDIAGQASGDHLVRIQNSGAEPTANFDPLHVIRTGGGDAHFALLGERVDLGAFSYALEREGDDWHLSGMRESVSPSTRTVQALFNTAPSIWYGELSSLRSRMGEVRASGQGGAWMRSYGNRYAIDTGGGLSYSQQQLGFALGADTLVRQPDGHWLVGVLAGHSHSDLNLSRGSTGTVDSYYVGAYGTWLADDGWYLDGVLKLNQFQNQAEVGMSDGSRAAGRYRSHGLGASLELGKHIALNDELFVEPFAQLSGLAVGGRRYRLDNDLQAENGGTHSLLGKAGATLGRTHVLATGGIVQPYLKAALAQEFASDNQVRVNGHRFANDLSGTRGELGAGVAVSMSDNLQLHAHLDYMKGEGIEQPWGVNVGLRYGFDL